MLENNEKEKELEEMKERENEPSSAEDVPEVNYPNQDEVEKVEEEPGAKEAEVEDTGDTVTPSPEGEGEDVEAKANEEKMLTQSQVNELVGRARQEGRESALKELLTRYGVNDDAELDNVFGKGQAYDDLNDEFVGQGNSYKEALAENALLKAHIDDARWEDVKLILGGKGLEVNSENIEAMIPSHPEWRGAASQNVEEGRLGTPQLGEAEFEVMKKEAMNKPVVKEEPATLRKLGNEITVQGPQETDEEKAKKLFGL